MISNGMLDKAKQNALRNITVLAKYSEKGIPIIFSEPSCFSALKDDYFDIVPESSKLKDLSNNIYLLEEFLFEKIDGLEKIVTSDKSSKVFIHGHCHQRSLNHFESSLDLLKRFGFEVENSDAGCCGMAGSFGYEKDHYEISKQIGEDILFPKIRELSNENQVCVTGVSCLEQIKHFTHTRPIHIAELLSKKISE